jgi:hypothetical protein
VISPPGRELGADHREQEFRDAIGVFGAEPGDGAPDLGVREPLDQRLFVVLEIHPRRGSQGRSGCGVHVAEEEGPGQGVLGGLVDQPVVGQVREIRQGLVAAIE